MKILENFKDIFTSPYFYIPIIICLVVIIMISQIKPIQAAMKHKIIEFAGIRMDIWSISHILLYMYFGYVFPDYFAEFFIIGIIWELFESSFHRDTFDKLIGCHNSVSQICEFISKIKPYDFWYGKCDDIIMNMLGFTIGVIIKKSTCI